MRDVLSWSLNIGRVGGVQVRLHASLLVLAAYVLHLSTQHDFGRLQWYGMSIIGVLLASIALHEWAHNIAAEKLGGQMSSAVLWPFGGMTSASVPTDPVSETLVAMAGPAMNLLVCSLAAMALQTHERPLADLLNPLTPPFMLAREEPGLPWLAMTEATFWINWVIVLANLLPAQPMDGARAVRAGLWYALGRRAANRLTSWLGQATAIGLVFAAFWLRSGEHSAAVMPLVCLACVLFFSSQSESERTRDPFGEEWPLGEEIAASFGLESSHETEPRRPGPLRLWIEKCRAERRRKRQQQEEGEERRVDAILARVHETGIDGLDPQERALLQRVSARYRNRLGRS